MLFPDMLHLFEEKMWHVWKKKTKKEKKNSTIHCLLAQHCTIIASLFMFKLIFPLFHHIILFFNKLCKTRGMTLKSCPECIVC